MAEDRRVDAAVVLPTELSLLDAAGYFGGEIEGSQVVVGGDALMGFDAGACGLLGLMLDASHVGEVHQDDLHLGPGPA